MNIDISIIIPMYNSEKFILRTLDSISATKKNFNVEVIVVDDGSTDKSKNIVETYLKSHNNVKLLKQKNSGVSIARNRGLEVTKGKYIMFMDSDDILTENSLEILYNNAEKYVADISIGLIKVEKKGKIIRKIIENNEIELFNQNKMIEIFLKGKANFDVHSACAKLYRSEICKSIKFEENRSSNEDRFFLYEAINKSTKIVSQNSVVYIYEKRENSLSNKKADKRLFDSIYFAEKINKDIRIHQKWAIDLSNYNLLITNMLVYRTFYRNMESTKEYKKDLKRIRKNIIELSKIVYVNWFKSVEISIIKYCNFAYFIFVKIFDLFRRVCRNGKS